MSLSPPILFIPTLSFFIITADYSPVHLCNYLVRCERWPGEAGGQTESTDPSQPALATHTQPHTLTLDTNYIFIFLHPEQQCSSFHLISFIANAYLYSNIFRHHQHTIALRLPPRFTPPLPSSFPIPVLPSRRQESCCIGAGRYETGGVRGVGRV